MTPTHTVPVVLTLSPEGVRLATLNFALRGQRDPSEVIRMQTFTFDLGAWTRRLVGHNPPVRTADRVQAAITLLIALVAMLAVPIAAAAGTAIHERLVDEYMQERLSRKQVDATATASAESREVPQMYAQPQLTEISWEVDGLAHTDVLRTEHLRAREHLTLWVDDEGRSNKSA